MVKFKSNCLLLSTSWCIEVCIVCIFCAINISSISKIKAIIFCPIICYIICLNCVEHVKVHIFMWSTWIECSEEEVFVWISCVTLFSINLIVLFISCVTVCIHITWLISIGNTSKCTICCSKLNLITSEVVTNEEIKFIS